MVYLINKNDLGFDSHFCHKIIQYRNKFLVDCSLPEITNTNLFPSSHLPINFINDINDEIFDKINNNIFKTICEKYNVDSNELVLNVCFYVENSYKSNRNYCNYYSDYDYGFLILLNENTYYTGGEICIDDKEIDISDNILFFNKNDKFHIRNILTGNQAKIIGYFNFNYCYDNKLLKYFLRNKLNLKNKKTNLYYVSNIIDLELHEKHFSGLFINNLMKNNTKLIKENNNLQYAIIDDSIYIHVIKLLHDCVAFNNDINDILLNYNIQKKHLLPLKVLIIKNNTDISYFSSLIGDEYAMFLNLKTEIKLTILVFLNDVDGNIFFPNQDIYFAIKKGDAIVVPNCFLYSYYFKINYNEPLYCIQYSFY